MFHEQSDSYFNFISCDKDNDYFVGMQTLGSLEIIKQLLKIDGYIIR